MIVKNVWGNPVLRSKSFSHESACEDDKLSSKPYDKHDKFVSILLPFNCFWECFM